MERALDSSAVLCTSNNFSLFAVSPLSLSFCVYLTPKPSEYPFYLRHAMSKLRHTHMKGQLFRLAWLPISRLLSLPRRLQVVSLVLSPALACSTDWRRSPPPPPTETCIRSSSGSWYMPVRGTNLRSARRLMRASAACSIFKPASLTALFDACSFVYLLLLF